MTERRTAAPHPAYSIFTPANTTELERRLPSEPRPAPAPPAVPAALPQQVALDPALQRPFNERAQQAHEQRVARQLCRRLNAEGRCPGECVVSQLDRGVPLHQLSGLTAFDEEASGGGRPR